VSLDEASPVIHRQYGRINRALKKIMDHYHRLKDEFDVLILAQAKLHLVDSRFTDA
jgi:hypothetical protein